MSLERLDRMDQNLIINGLVKPLCQRAPGSVVNLSTFFAYQLIDRFMGRYTGNFNSTPTWEVIEDNSVMTGDFTDASGTLEIQQRIESLLASSMAGEKVSASMELYSESCTEVTLSLYYPDTENDFSSEILIEPKTFTIPTNQNHLLKWEGVTAGYDVRNGAQFRVKFHNPGTLNTPSLHKVKKIKLNIGEKAQEWSPCGRNLIEDRELCLRYYEKGHHRFRVYTTITNNNNYVQQTIYFSINKRDVPLMTYSEPHSTEWTYTNAAVIENHVTNNSNERNMYTDWTADAEL